MTVKIASAVSLSLCCLVGGCLAGAKSSGGSHPGTDGGAQAGDAGTTLPPNAVPFEAVTPATYVPKIKNLLTGLPANDAEIQMVVADPDALKGLIDTWMALPQFQGRMLDFFRNAFQQNQVKLAALFPSLGIRVITNGKYDSALERNLMDSFPLTVWQLVANGQPLNTAVTTNQYMMTTRMMTLLSYADQMHVDDTGKGVSSLYTQNALTGYSVDVNETATLDETLDPTSAKYMHWKIPTTYTTCSGPTLVSYTNSNGMYEGLYEFMSGTMQPYDPCVAMHNRTSFPTQFIDSDYTDWRMVTVTQGSDTLPRFWDLIKLRDTQNATSMTLQAKRIGFFGTLAFDSNWATNTSNEARVTANQALIVAIGQSIDGENSIATFPVDATDGDHATNLACTGCHNQLDPYKQFFRQSYTLTYQQQQDTSQLAIPANFGIDGVKGSGVGVDSISTILATHPRFALAWAEKLHFWATSTAAIETDPAIVAVASAFQQNNFDFKTLVRELFSSPLITLAAPTQTTTTNGVIMSVARRDQFCTSLSNRMGLPDVCGLTTAVLTPVQANVSSRALLMPVDAYYRAYALPSLPTDPDLFYRQSVESVCQQIAAQVIDVKTGTSKYVSTDPTTAIADFVATVMGLATSDPRASDSLAILTDNFTAAKTAGATANQALTSTFTLACISPPSVLLGL